MRAGGRFESWGTTPKLASLICMVVAKTTVLPRGRVKLPRGLCIICTMSDIVAMSGPSDIVPEPERAFTGEGPGDVE